MGDSKFTCKLPIGQSDEGGWPGFGTLPKVKFLPWYVHPSIVSDFNAIFILGKLYY